MKSFCYHNYTFNVEYDPLDNSGLGSILEIVTNNEYQLNLFTDNKDKVFFDIGANIGIATIIMAKLNPESIIYSFEPNKLIFEMLLKNIKFNNLTNVKAFNLAVSNKINKHLTLSLHNTWSGASSTCADQHKFFDHWNTNNSYTVDCISFDDVINNNNIDSIHLLKIDCEGAEFDIIYDSELFKTGIVKNMVGEFHDLKYNKIFNKSKNLIDYSKNYITGLVNISIFVI